MTKKAGNKYINRVEQKMVQQANKPELSYAFNPTDDIFKGDLLEKAKEIEEKFEAVTDGKTEGNLKKPVKNKVKKIKKKPVVAKKVKKAKFVKSKALKKKKIK